MATDFLLVGVPVGDADREWLPYTPPPDRTQTPCSVCGMLIWIGPRIIARMAESGKPVYCPYCARKVVPYGPDDIHSLGGT